MYRFSLAFIQFAVFLYYPAFIYRFNLVKSQRPRFASVVGK